MTSTLYRANLEANPNLPADLSRTAALTALRNAHRAASECVAALDLDDGPLWTRVGPLVSALSSAAYDLSASVRGRVPNQKATGVPPVVRARELACSQGHLFEDLERHPGVSSQVLEASGTEVARLVRMIRESLPARLLDVTSHTAPALSSAPNRCSVPRMTEPRGCRGLAAGREATIPVAARSICPPAEEAARAADSRALMVYRYPTTAGNN